MPSQCALPSTREQAQHALLLLGAPAPARLVVDVHTALFDGDLDMPSLVALVRAEQRAVTAAQEGVTAEQRGDPAEPSADFAARQGGTAGAAGPADAYQICLGLTLDLTASRGVLALAAWPLARRIVTPAVARADALMMVVRVVEFVATRPGLGATTMRLLRQLAATVPGGPEAVNVLDPGALAQAARLALANPALTAAVGR